MLGQNLKVQITQVFGIFKILFLDCFDCINENKSDILNGIAFNAVI
jgi:hypothetical protein